MSDNSLNDNRLDGLSGEEQTAKSNVRKNNLRLGIVIGAVVIVVGVLAWLLFAKSSEAAEQAKQIEQLQLENEMIQSANEFRQLDEQYSQLETNQALMISNDSIVEKYNAAKAQVEKLLNELQNEKNKSASQIAKLKAEIETLKGILRDYTRMIAELKEENEGLKAENQEVKNRNNQLTQQVTQVTRDNQELSERMVLAEKINVTGVNITPLNKKGKKEKNITKARRLMVTFNISPNNSTPPGEKAIYLRIVSPEGNLLGNGGSFDFEGGSLASTARITVEYAGEEIGGVSIYYDVDTALNPGDYTVELFCDGYRLASRHFTLTK